MHGMAALALRDFAERTTLDADAGWHAQQERLRAADAFEPELPSTLRAELRPYQHDGFRWLARLARWGAGACLADDMGLGKTVQTLALLLDRALDGPALVVAPTSVVANWLDEARRFTPTLNVISYTGAASSRTGRLDKLGPFDVVVTTLATFAETLDELLASRHKVLVFSQFVKHLKLIEEYLAGAGIAFQYLDGSTRPGRGPSASRRSRRGRAMSS